MSLRFEIANINSQIKAQGASVQQVRRDMSEVKIGWTNSKKRILDQEKKIVQQGQVIGELEKKVSDLNQKFVDLSAELQILKGIKDGGESSKSIPHLHNEEYASHEVLLPEDSSDKYRRNKGLKRKNGGKNNSLVKRSKK